MHSEQSVSHRRGALVAGALLVVPLIDELVCGLEVLQLPAIRDSMALNCAETGMLASIGALVSAVTRPILLALSARGRRAAWFVGGCAALVISLLVSATAGAYAVLLCSFALSGPGSDVVCDIAETSLADANPERTETMMARWCVLGSVGDLVGPACVGLIAWSGLSWRAGFGIGGLLWLLCAVLLYPATRTVDARRAATEQSHARARASRIRSILALLRDAQFLKAAMPLVLVGLYDETLLVFASLFLHDRLGLDAEAVSALIFMLTLTALAVFVMIERLLSSGTSSRRILIAAAGLSLAGCITLATAETWWVAACAMPLLATGTAVYPVLQARAYRVRPGHARVVAASLALFAPVSAMLPWALGLVADALSVRVSILLIGASSICTLLMAGGREDGHRP